MASRVGFVILVLGIYLFDLRLILREEANLAATQGEKAIALTAQRCRDCFPLASKVAVRRRHSQLAGRISG